MLAVLQKIVFLSEKMRCYIPDFARINVFGKLNTSAKCY